VIGVVAERVKSCEPIEKLASLESVMVVEVVDVTRIL
jgi:hypothetical protein